MAVYLPTPRYWIQHSRFTKHDGLQLIDLSLSSNGIIAVTGINTSTHRSFIDVYTTYFRHSDSSDKPKLIYSKEFEKYITEDGMKYDARYISFIDSYDDNGGLVIATCIGDKIELIDLNQDHIIKSRKVTLEHHGDEITCLSVRERREILIGFYVSNKISVYGVMDLNEIKSIILQGIQHGYFLTDMTAIGDRLFVLEVLAHEESNPRSLIFEEKNGRILSELTKPTDTVKWYVKGLALNITLNVVAVQWSQTYKGERKGKDVIVFYSLLSENNCSFLIVETEFGVEGIEISERGDRLITKKTETGEVKVYDMAELFRYGHLKKHLQQQLQGDDSFRVTDFFAFPDNQRDAIVKSDTSKENLLAAFEENGVIEPCNVDRLAEAFTELGIKSTCSYLVEFYQKTRCTLQVTTYGRFLANLSVHLTASSPADLCRYFDISDEKKDSIISSPDPGLSLLLALDEIGIINPSEVKDLEQPLSELELVQAEAKLHEYQSFIEEGTQLKRQTTLTEKGKKELFIKCLQNTIKSWYETATPVPWKKSCRWRSTDLFVGSGLVLTDSKAKRSLIDIDEECKLQYNQIINHNKLKGEKRMILEGAPGSGKTMVSSQVAYDWAQGKISEVDVLIFLPLKFVNNINIVKAVKRFYFSEYDSISVNDIKSFLTNEDLQSCLILDGFEEYNSAEMTPAGEPSEVAKVMEKSKFSNCKVILTCRSEYAKDLPPCPMLRIGRFGEKERHSYIEKVFADNKEMQQKIKMTIENNPFILDLCSVPLLFVLAVHNIESIVALQEGQLDRVAPFMENMVRKICSLPDSKSEGSVPDLEGVSDESQLEWFAYNGLCKGQQILSWKRDVLKANITNLKQFLDCGILVGEEGIDDGSLRIVKNETTQNEFSQDKKKTKKIEPTGVDQKQQSAQVSAGAMPSSYLQGYFVRKGSNENVPKTGPSVITQELAFYEKVQVDRNPAREYPVTLSPASGPVQFKPETQSEQELSESQNTSNSFATKDFPLKVKFLHKVIQEWFASKHLSSLMWKSLDGNSFGDLWHNVLPQISPIDLHYILRFVSYLCAPACCLIMDFLSQNHRTVNGVIPEYIMNCICLCFAEWKQENVPQVTDLEKTLMTEGMTFVVEKLCREVIIIRSDESRITQQSKVAMLKYAASKGIQIMEVHLVDVVVEVDESSTTLNSGVTFDTFNKIQVLEMRRWDQHLKEKDYQSIVKLVLSSDSIKKARLHFPSQPPDIEKEALGDLPIHDKTVEWIIGPKLTQMLNMETFEWESTSDNFAKNKKVLAKVVLSHTPQSDDELLLVEDHVIEITSQLDPWLWEGIVKGKKGHFPSHCVVLLPADEEEREKKQQEYAPPEKARVKYDYDALEPHELTIKVGDIITNISMVEYGWWEGIVNGKRGMFPSNFVEEYTATSKKSIQNKTVLSKVIRSHTPQGEDELYLIEKDIVEITSQPDPWWWEGIVKGKKGYFPSYCVDLIEKDNEREEREETKQQECAAPVKAEVLYDYDAVEPDELTIKAGDTITNISIADGGWWKGVLNGKKGNFPSNFVKIYAGSPEQSSQNMKVLAKVTASYIPQSDREVILVEGDVIEITSQQDTFWWEGVVNGKQGHFPSHCVVPLREDGEERKQQDYATPGAYSWHKENMFYTEAVISREGGKLCIPNTGVKLYIPPNAFEDAIDQCLLQMRIILPGTCDVPATSFTSNTSTVVELLPNNLRLKQTVILTLPHCLDLKVDRGDGSYTAKIFISHHEKGNSPVWEAKSNLLYYLDDTKCIIWLESFCWVKFEVNGAIVKGKKIQVFAAGKVLESGDNIVETEVGYFPDLPSGGEILRNNKNLILSQQKPFLFLKKTKLPLTLSLLNVTPSIWKPLGDLQEIPYDCIASSVEYSCPFIFENESRLLPIPVCIFWISQGSRGFQLTMRPKVCPSVFTLITLKHK
ncbi:Intersectin-2 [Holothuria leucospilota]|uniref:Intersectin-2 n=1 Tax=Holothuria leucospilota TaxID=206669 RepID=A0A9Q1BC04_HOLLE|nr:Intersectin-2 [Holothuria leucospilota]